MCFMLDCHFLSYLITYVILNYIILTILVIISTVILLPSADLFKKGFCQLQAKVCAQITG